MKNQGEVTMATFNILGFNQEKINAIYEDLLKHGYKFTFKSLETVWQYFIKPEGLCYGRRDLS